MTTGRHPLAAGLPMDSAWPCPWEHGTRPDARTYTCNDVLLLGEGALRWPTLRWAGDLGIWGAPSDKSGSFSEEEEGRTERPKQKSMQLFAAARPGLIGSRSYTKAETDGTSRRGARCPSSRPATPDLSPRPLWLSQDFPAEDTCPFKPLGHSSHRKPTP